jgi:hypothetical protein
MNASNSGKEHDAMLAERLEVTMKHARCSCGPIMTASIASDAAFDGVVVSVKALLAAIL